MATERVQVELNEVPGVINKARIIFGREPQYSPHQLGSIEAASRARGEVTYADLVGAFQRVGVNKEEAQQLAVEAYLDPFFGW